MQPTGLRCFRALAILALLVALSACAAMGLGASSSEAEQVVDRRAPLTATATLNLPLRPGYPRTETLIQTVVGQYGERRTAFQAVLDLSPERVGIIITAPSGPRIMAIDWTSDAITVERSSMAPEELSGLDILGDVFLSLWPEAAIAGALPSGFSVTQRNEGRLISGPEGAVINITSKAIDANTRRMVMENLAFGYTLTIVTEADT